jgi:hypothetical protein
VIFESGKGFLWITLFTSLRSASDQKEPSGFDIVNIGHAHSEWLIFLNTPYSHNCLFHPLVASLESVGLGMALHDMA